MTLKNWILSHLMFDDWRHLWYIDKDICVFFTVFNSFCTFPYGPHSICVTSWGIWHKTSSPKMRNSSQYIEYQYYKFQLFKMRTLASSYYSLYHSHFQAFLLQCNVSNQHYFELSTLKGALRYSSVAEW